MSLNFPARFLFIDINQNDIRTDFYNLAPGNTDLKLSAHAAQPFSRSRDDQRLDASVALVKFQVPDIAETFTIRNVDYFLLL